MSLLGPQQNNKEGKHLRTAVMLWEAFKAMFITTVMSILSAIGLYKLSIILDCSKGFFFSKTNINSLENVDNIPLFVDYAMYICPFVIFIIGALKTYLQLTIKNSKSTLLVKAIFNVTLFGIFIPIAKVLRGVPYILYNLKKYNSILYEFEIPLSDKY
jgi:hypothetical protein